MGNFMGKIVVRVGRFAAIRMENFRAFRSCKRKLEGGMETAFQKVGGIGG
jgi:hypothetical protein